MRYIKRFDFLIERFDKSTLSRNVKGYNKFLKNNTERSGIVGWEVPGSQEENWSLITKHIKNGDSVLDYGCGVGDILSFLEKEGIKISNYKGVDINDEFINIAKETYPDNEFQLIDNISQISGSYDVVCASGVFTWFITKRDFIKSINKLYELANREVIMTFNYTPSKYISSWFWGSSLYKRFNETLFEELFPDWNLEFEKSDGEYDNQNYTTLLVRIIK